MELKDFTSTNHPYYGEAGHTIHYDSFLEFFEEMGTSDVDMNLCYRWDIEHEEGENENGEWGILDNVVATIFTIQQRKCRIVKHIIRTFKEEDLPNFLTYINPHMETIKEMWLPLSFETLAKETI